MKKVMIVIIAAMLCSCANQNKTASNYQHIKVHGSDVLRSGGCAWDK